MLSALGIGAILVAVVSAGPRTTQNVEDGNIPYKTWALGPIYYDLTNRTQALVDKALALPNATRSIEFSPFGKDVPATSPDGDVTDFTWTWRVNVSDLEVPHSKLGHETDAVPHMVATSYDFTWSSGGNMSTELRGDVPFCVRILQPSSGWAPNMTNTFAEEDVGSTSCEPALGATCVEAILADPMLNGTECNSSVFEYRWSDLPACASSVGYSLEEWSKGGLAGMTANLNAQRPKWPTLLQYTSGERLLSMRSGIYDPEARDAARAFRNETRALQMLLVQTEAPVKSGRQRTSQLLCTRVGTGEYEGSGSSLEGMGFLVVVVFWAAVMVM